MRLGEACLLVGHVDDARRLALRALKLSQERREQADEVWAPWLLPEIADRQEAPDWPDSERRYLEASARASALGMRLLVAHCNLGLGKLYRRTGQREQAREHPATASTAAFSAPRTRCTSTASAPIELTVVKGPSGVSRTEPPRLSRRLPNLRG